MTKFQPCGSVKAHGRHEWYWKNILRRDCAGLVVGQCSNDDTHGPHYFGEYRDELCRGLGLAGVCEHGVQVLNECDDCPV